MSARLGGMIALVTRPAAQNEALCAAIRAAGGAALALPLLEIAPLDPRDAAIGAVLAGLGRSELAIFVSTNAVRHALAAASATGIAWPERLQCLAIGQATRAELAKAGIVAGAAEAAMNSEELLVHTALATVRGRRVVIFRGEGGRGLLAQRLRERGADVEECMLYRRIRARDASASRLAALLEGQPPDALLVTSGETLAVLIGLLRELPAGTIPAHAVLVVPGQRVAAQAAEAGLAIRVAANATDAAMLDALAAMADLRRGRTTETG